MIVGEGFGGLSAAKALRGVSADVVLIDRKNHHLFQPLLYQVATAALSPADIAHPVRAALRGADNIEITKSSTSMLLSQRNSNRRALCVKAALCC